jgi:hypothetical protein
MGRPRQLIPAAYYNIFGDLHHGTFRMQLASTSLYGLTMAWA